MTRWPDVRRPYVGAVRRLRALARRVGLLERLEASNRRWVRHLRTLFAVYDAADLSTLDLPWWTYQAADEVEAFLATRRDAAIFEYGSGASTVWLARRATRLVTVEHDLQFARTVAELVTGYGNVELRVVEARPATPCGPRIGSARRGHERLDFSAYVAAIDEANGPFDLVVIDGRARIACLRRAVDHLAAEGFIVFDDIRRRRYREALAMPELETRVTFGATPTLPFPTSTGLLHRRDQAR